MRIFVISTILFFGCGHLHCQSAGLSLWNYDKVDTTRSLLSLKWELDERVIESYGNFLVFISKEVGNRSYELAEIFTYDELDMLFHPNQSDGLLNIYIDSDQLADMNLLSSRGELISHRQVGKGRNRIEFDLADLVTDEYILRTSSRDGSKLRVDKILLIRSES